MTTDTLTYSSEWKSGISQILQALHPRLLLPCLSAGVVGAIIQLSNCLSFAVLIFSGILSPAISIGIGLALFSGLIINTIFALLSSVPGISGSAKGGPAVIYAIIAADIVSTMPSTASFQETVLTVVAAIGLSTLLTGLVFLLLGHLKLGGVVRFIPYPVIGGFLAGMGWLLLRGSITTMADIQFTYSTISQLFQPALLVRWLPGILFAVLLCLISRCYRHFLVMPGMLLVASGVFYSILWLSGTSIAEARTQGLLLQSFSMGALWQPLKPSDLGGVYWSVIFGQWGNLITIVLVSLVECLLTISGIEIATQRNMELDRELQTAGLANIACGVGCGLAGYHWLATSVLAHKMKAKYRLTGLFSAAFFGITLFVSTSLVSYFPKPLLGGLLAYLGLSFLFEWVYQTWYRFSKTEYAIVVLILIVTGTIGFMPGVGVGLAAAALLFVVNYSHTKVIKHELSGANYRSNHVRSPELQRVLDEQGNCIAIFKLQGFIFFGTANILLVKVRQWISDPERLPLRYVLFDFREVGGLDATALWSFVKMRQLAELHQYTLVFTHLTPVMLQQFKREGFCKSPDAVCRLFPDLDHGLEWCEDQVLSIEQIQTNVNRYSLQQELEQVFSDRALVSPLMKYFKKMEVEAGYYLIRQDDPGDELYFIESGLVTVQLQKNGGQPIRLQIRGVGAMVGETGVFTGGTQSVSVVTTQPSILYRLTTDALQQMQAHDPQVLVEFQRFILGLVTERLAESIRVI